MSRNRVRLLSSVALATLLSAAPAWAQTSLGSAEAFAVLAGTGVTNTGATTITGDLGTHPNPSVTGAPTVIGTIHAADVVALNAKNDLVVQYNALASAACLANLTGQNLGGMVLTPGVYCFSSSAQLTGTLTLNALSNPAATFIFKMGSTLTTAPGSSVVMINPGNPCGVMWQVGSSATIGTGTTFIGTIVALTNIALQTGATIIGGRALARNAQVTMDTNTISIVPCTAGGLTPPAVPTLATWAMIALSGLLALAGFLTLRRRQLQPLS